MEASTEHIYYSKNPPIPLVTESSLIFRTSKIMKDGRR